MQRLKSRCIINLETYPSPNSPTVTGDETKMKTKFKVGDFVSFIHSSARPKIKRRGNIERISGKSATVNCSGDLLKVPLAKLERLSSD